MRTVLTVPRNELFVKHTFEGFCPLEEHNFLAYAFEKGRVLERTDELENNPSEKQMITYAWIVNRATRQVLVYQRATKAENYTETRLRGKWSCGIGGHIDASDFGKSINAAFEREIYEELKLEQQPKIEIIGFVNHESGAEAMHFGIVAIAEVEGAVHKGDDEMSGCQLLTIEEVDAMMADPEKNVEKWTRLTWPVIKKYLTD